MNAPILHDYHTCNCGACKLVRLELKNTGTTNRPIPTGPVSELLTPPSKQKPRRHGAKTQKPTQKEAPPPAGQ